MIEKGREEKLKLRLHLKNCPNPPECIVNYKMLANRNHMTYEDWITKGIEISTVNIYPIG